MSSREARRPVSMTVSAAGIRAKLPWLPLTVLALLVLAAAFAPWLAPYDPTQSDITAARLAPGAPGHPLGTDLLGRDVLSRLIWGARPDAVG
jgi:peptide/nickel transport system permease protein